jgi:hypothetical protein
MGHGVKMETMLQRNENRAATGRERYHERGTRGTRGIAPSRSRLGYILRTPHFHGSASGFAY